MLTKIPEGSRNTTLYERGVRYKLQRMPNLLELLQEDNRQLCDPPLDETEVEKMVNHLLSHGNADNSV